MFISSLLERANLNVLTIQSLTNDENMIEFRKAFTHKSYDNEFNYEYLEFRGDVVVNLVAAQYLRERFPKIISTTWLTRLKHNIVGKKVLSTIAKREKFVDNIQYDKELRNIKKDSFDYISMLEDTVEAFFGALVLVCRRTRAVGVGYAISYQILKSFYDKQEISLDYEDTFDYVSRVKLIYDPRGWDFKKSKQTTYIWSDNLFVTTLHAYHPEDKTKKIILAKKTGQTKDQSIEEACKHALNVLKNKYLIEEKIPPIYDNKKDDDDEELYNDHTIIPDGFKESISNILMSAMVKESAIKVFTREEYLLEFRMSLVHSSYNSRENYNIYKFEGVTVLDLNIVDYIGQKFPNIISEKWLTNIKQSVIGKNITQKSLILEMAEKSGIERFALYGSEIKESLEKYPDKRKNTKYKKMIESVMKAFIGALVSIIDGVKGRGVGYAVAYNLFSNNADKRKISINYKDVFNPKGRLKELYNKRKWPFEQNIISVYDEENSSYTTTIFGYPIGDKIYREKNKTLLVTLSGRLKDETSQKASEKALSILNKVYHISEIPPDPYEF